MILDFKIIIESRKFGINGNSFSSCLMKWAEFCRFNLKIPAEILGNYYPPVKDFFTLLKNIALRGEIPQHNRENFLRLLVENTDIIKAAFADLIKVLREKFSAQLDGLNDNEIKKILTYMPNSSFTDSQSFFQKNLNDKADDIRKGQLKNELLKTIMDNSPSAKDIQDAIAYLEKRPSFFAAMKDSIQIETAFRKIFIGKYIGLLDDNDEIRNALSTNFQPDPYNWYPSSAANDFLKNSLKKNILKAALTLK